MTLKKVVNDAMDILFFLMMIAKSSAAIYFIGLLGGFSNDMVSAKEVVIKGALTLAFIFFG